MTPTTCERVAAVAADAPGSITPSTGTFATDRTCSSATADAVLQAMIVSFTPSDSRNACACNEYSMTVSEDFDPYGTRAVSPKYTMFSYGISDITCCATVRPPIPESKSPMGSEEREDIRDGAPVQYQV